MIWLNYFMLPFLTLIKTRISFPSWSIWGLEKARAGAYLLWAACRCRVWADMEAAEREAGRRFPPVIIITSHTSFFLGPAIIWRKWWFSLLKFGN